MIEIDLQKLTSDRKKRGLTVEQKTRLALIAEWADGATHRHLTTKYAVHPSTVTEWLGYYAAEGLEGLKRPIRPIQRHNLDIQELRNLLPTVNASDNKKLLALIDLVESKQLNETATLHGITPQGLAKWRRQFLAGELPRTINL